MSPFMIGETAFSALGRLRVNSMTWSCGKATLTSFECEGGCRTAVVEVLLAPMSSWIRCVDDVGENGRKSATYGPRVTGTRTRSRDTGTGTRSDISIALRGNHGDRPRHGTSRPQPQLYFLTIALPNPQVSRSTTREHPV